MTELKKPQNESPNISLTNNGDIQNKVLQVAKRVKEVKEAGRRNLWPTSLLAWVKDNWTSRGEPLDFDEHLYLLQIYEDQSQDITYMKSAQTGATERMITEAMWLPDQYRENAIYIFPTTSTVSDLVQERIDEPLNNKEYLRRVSGRAKKIMGKQADKIGLKRMSKGFVYFRGSNKPTQITSVPADAIFVDEVDRMIVENIPYFAKRLEHSKRKWQRWASTPTIPNFGIHKRFITTDQHYRYLKCPNENCNEWQILDFFENVKYEMEEVNPTQCKWAKLVCKKCETEIVPWKVEGEWRPENPLSNKRGYFISKLHSPYLDLPKMVESSKQTAEWEIQQFFNQDLGLPHEPRGGKITDEDLIACRRDFKAGLKEGDNFMGIDVGKVLHVTIQNSEKKVVYINTVNDFSDLDELMVSYNIKQAVIDALPETRKSQEFANKYAGRVLICYYSGLKEVKDNEWFKVDDQKINTDRTLSLDMVTARIRTQDILLPSNIEDFTEFKDHMKALTRVTTKNSKGELKTEYVQVGADHFYHSLNYSNMAKAEFEKTVEPEVWMMD